MTADGHEAEVATPPVPVAPGAAADLEALSRLGHQRLRAALPPGFRLDGYSTHLNVSVPDRLAVLTAERFARHLALPQMLLLDRASSPGLLVRPRRGRLEIGGEYAVGDQLRAAVTFAIAGAVACAHHPRMLDPPPRPVLRLERAQGRFGWYVDRCAAGVDLYAEGRRSAVGTNAGVMSAGSLLQRTWAVLRPLAIDLVGTADARLVDAFVDGRLSLPIERPERDPRGVAPQVPAAAIHGRVVDDLTRPGFALRTVAARWNCVAFEVDDGRRRRYVVVPAARLASFVAAIDDGEYDGRLSGWLARPARRLA